MLVYLDASAIVKLVRREPESRALLAALRSWPERVTSVVSAVEVPRAVRRAGADARSLRRADRVLDRLGLVELDAPVRARAAALEPAVLRTLDAIHIATALELAPDVETLITYDRRQARSARSAGLAVIAPA